MVKKERTERFAEIGIHYSDTSFSPSKSKHDSIKPHYTGHRERLRQRFKESPQSLADYELLELFLFRPIARSDTKPLAKALLKTFGSLTEVLAASPERLKEVNGCGDAVITELKLISHLFQRVQLSQVEKRNIFSSWDKVIAYCKTTMAYETREQFRILFLDKKNGLIADEIQQKGTVDHTPVYVREVVRRALELSSSALILLHNHPSGDTTPSHEDIAMTKKLIEACDLMNITIHDHIIIGRDSFSSFKTLKLF